MTQPLPFSLNFPLQGSQLIEASAGTGKTFTISTLYLRLVLGHGSEKTRFNKPLLPPEILVMTFTEAATQELRDRIRSRLSEAARYFRNELATPDEILTCLRNDYLEMEWPNCAQQLEIAAQWMDEASVSTIHSWCQRMLREHAFDSGNLFHQHLETDHSELLASVIRDYWRIFCYPMTGLVLDWVREHWKTPEHLQNKLLDLLDTELPVITQTPTELIETQLTQQKKQLAELKKPWLTWTEELRLLCDEALAKKQVDGRKLQKRFYDNWCNKLTVWATNPDLIDLDLGTGFERLSNEGMQEIWKQGTPPDHPALTAISTLRHSLNNLPNPTLDLLSHAVNWVKQRFHQEKIRRAEIGFDDLLTRLDDALQKPSGKRLAKVIRQQFPVAMVDEFQDTDPIQYRILSKVYLEDTEGTGLFLIGDPKQAIYAFRGADIYTYLQARRHIEQRLHQLDTNYRSSQAMVNATNHLFNYAEQHNNRGAFLFKTPETNALPFHPVKAQGKKDAFVINNQQQTALTLWYQETPEPLTTTQYYLNFAEGCATEIARLLNLGQQSKAGFQQEKYLLPLRPSDIAILVRSGKEARIIREALSARNIRSVYLSDKDSVLDTQEAQDLLLWLEACYQPENEYLLRAALASATLNLSLQELDSYNLHENIWEQRILQFRDYQSLWRTQGVLPMLRRLLQDFELPERLLSYSQEGERKLTNLLHLAELLQQAANELDGEQALIRYLAERLSENKTQNNEYIVRLESDEQLVKVITIHKSKGLEYPLIFLPFICSFKAVNGHFLPIRYHDERGKQQVSLFRKPEIIQQADQERLAEDLRLLYVAITRAKYNCWLGISDLKQGNTKSSVLHLSSLGYLLNNGLALEDSGQLTACLSRLTEGCQNIQLKPLPEPNVLLFNEQPLTTTKPQAREMEKAISRFWWISSYSSLQLAAKNINPLDEQITPPETATNQNLLDDDTQPLSLVNTAMTKDIHGFPKGALAGTFLHDILEWAADKGFQTVLATPDETRDLIARRCNIRGWEHWIDILHRWLQDFLKQPLPLSNTTACLAELSYYLSEMEFMFASHYLNLEQLDQLVSHYILPNQVRPKLEPGMLNGMFKGFIDLTFEHEGRYYIADYKSNWLGENNTAYTPQAIQESMLTHRYDLQLALYQLALHRQLTARLPQYDYEQHTGGIFYLFLRGIHSLTNGVFYERVPFELIEKLDRLFAKKMKGNV